MLAIPIDTKDATVISQLYGNAPFFALLDLQCGEFSVCENGGKGDGEDTANFIIELGVKQTIFYHMGEGLFKRLDAKGIEVVSCGKAPLTIEEIYRGALDGTFKKVTTANSKTVLDAGSCTCTKNQ